MAVAVKPPQEVVTKKRPVPQLPFVSLAGMVYVIAALAIVFGLLPSLWRSIWPGDPSSWGSLIVLGMVSLAVIAGLGFVGGKLLGPNPPPGTRAGIFVALALVLLVAFVTKWVGATLEGWIYDNQWFGESGRMVGSIITGAIGALLLLWVARSFFKPGFVKFLETFEEQGWFSRRAYKPLQGIRVRRATTLGIILLGGAGVYSLIARNTLSSEPWAIAVPFTGVAKITPETMGDLDKLPVEEGAPEYQYKEWAVAVREKETEVRTRRREAALWAKTNWWQAFGGPPAVWTAEEERKQAEQKAAAAAAELSQMTLEIDRYVLRDRINSKLNPAVHVVIDTPGREVIEGFEHNTVVRKSDFEAKKAELEDEAATLNSREVTPVKPTVAYQSVPLLPNKALTVPLLLLALTIWFAWRLVNMPTFADFLIATEAEMNKVSWSSRRRLFQDTIVVLVTVLLLAGYLFVMDVAWQQLLSSRIIGVIRVEDDQDKIQKGADDRPLW